MAIGLVSKKVPTQILWYCLLTAVISNKFEPQTCVSTPNQIKAKGFTTVTKLLGIIQRTESTAQRAVRFY